MEFEVESIPADLCAVTLLHPEFILQTALDLYQGRSDGVVGAVTCSRAPRFEFTGLSELAIRERSIPPLTILVRAPRPKEWELSTDERRCKLIAESKMWPGLRLGLETLSFALEFEARVDFDKVMFSFPMVGSGDFVVLGEREVAVVERRKIDLHSGETTFFDLTHRSLATLVATYDLPESWDGDSTAINLSQSDASGQQIMSSSRLVGVESKGEVLALGLRPATTHLYLRQGNSPGLIVLPTFCDLTLKSGENHFEQIFGTAREFVVHAPLA